MRPRFSVRTERRPIRRQDDREDVISRDGVVIHNYLQAPTEDVDGPSFPPRETTDPWDITDGAFTG